jgi:hypothetical protein
MEVVVGAARIGRGPDHAGRLEAKLVRRAITGHPFSIGGCSLPGNHAPSFTQQWRGIFAEHRQRTNGADGHEIVLADALEPGLGAQAYDGDVVGADRTPRTLEELAFAPHALDQRNVGVGERDRKHKSRKAGAGANVGDALGVPHRGKLERAQGVREMYANRLLASGDGGRRVRIVGHDIQQLDEPGTRLRRERVAPRQGLDTLRNAHRVDCARAM